MSESKMSKEKNDDEARLDDIELKLPVEDIEQTLFEKLPVEDELKDEASELEEVLKKTPNTSGKKLENNEKYAIVSYFYKSCRIGDAKMAMILGEYIYRGVGEYYLALILSQLIGEDCHPKMFGRYYDMVKTYLNAVSTSKQKWHDHAHCTYIVAKATKWYQSDEYEPVISGVELEELRHIIKEKTLPKITFPKWVYDRHTWKGKYLHKSHAYLSPLDGAWDNRFNVKERWDKIVADNPSKSYKELVDLWIASHYGETGKS